MGGRLGKLIWRLEMPKQVLDLFVFPRELAVLLVILRSTSGRDQRTLVLFLFWREAQKAEWPPVALLMHLPVPGVGEAAGAQLRYVADKAAG